VQAPLFAEEGPSSAFLRGPSASSSPYSTTGRGNEPADRSLGMLDMTPYGRPEVGGQTPRAVARGPQPASPVGGHGAQICGTVRSDRRRRRHLGPGPPPACRSGPAPGATRGDPRAARGPYTMTQVRRLDVATPPTFGSVVTAALDAARRICTGSSSTRSARTESSPIEG